MPVVRHIYPIYPRLSNYYCEPSFISDIIQITMSAPNTSCGCCGPQEAEVTTLVPPFRVTTSEFSVSVKDRAFNEISRNFHPA